MGDLVFGVHKIVRKSMKTKGPKERGAAERARGLFWGRSLGERRPGGRCGQGGGLQRAMHRHAGPDVDHAEEFVDALATRRGRLPPAGRRKVIVRLGADDDRSVAGVIFVPEGVDTAGVGFAGHDDHRAAAALFQAGADGVEFIGGVDNGQVQDPDGFLGNTEAAKNLEIARIFGGMAQLAVLIQNSALLWMSEPNFAGVSALIELGSFHGSVGKVAGQDGDSIRFLDGVLADEPVAENGETKVGQQDGNVQEKEGDREEASKPTRNPFL